ncbi:MAG: hypothetical protein Q9220_006217 [cf. Caloplaca sp. 1 TL-2023]
MAREQILFLFGDQTVQTSSVIKQLHQQSKDYLFVQIFFRKATDALHDDFSGLPTAERRKYFPFESIYDLSESYEKAGVFDTAISSVLLCIAQLGSLIIHLENNPHVLVDGVSRVSILGLCTGLLPAAVLASATSIGDVLECVPHIVRISWGLGLAASRRSQHLEYSSESWAIIVASVPKDEQQTAIDKFHETMNIPPNKRAYISAETDGSITISGPPSTLKSLLSFSERLSQAAKAEFPIAAAFHAPHLREPDIKNIIGSSPLLERPLKKHTEIRSTSSGRPFSAHSMVDLLHQIIVDILQKPLNWSNVVANTVASLRTKEVSFVALGPTNAATPLRRALKAVGIKIIENQEVRPSLTARPKRGESGAIAVVGMSGRFPGSENLEDFWKHLEEGQDLVQQIPKNRFDLDTHFDPSGNTKNTTLTPFGCFIDRPGIFDRRLFNLSPREAGQTDPGQRLLLMTTYEALEMAGYSPDAPTDRRRIGTYFGQTIDDWREHNAAQDIDLYYVTGNIRAFGPGRVNYHFKWEGPSMSLDTACSSSSVAIQTACSALSSRDCDMAIAGGSNILTGSDMFAGLSRGGFLSSSGNCKTFDSTADGYCRGEAVGAVVLKRLDDAIADRDNIQAVITAASTNHSAEAVSITHPHAKTQQRLYRKVLQDAVLDPEDVDYVEMHGTGTQAGDAAEFRSVSTVFSDRRESHSPLYMGTVKPNFGHSEAVRSAVIQG